MKTLSTTELRLLTEEWKRWAEEPASQSQRRSRSRLLFVFLLIRYGALRLGEALSINDRKDLDRSTCTIKVIKERGREVQISSQAMEELFRLIESPKMCSLRGEIAKLDQGYVRKSFYTIAQRCNFDKNHVCPRNIRHSRGAELLRCGVPLVIVQKFLGQQSPAQMAAIVRNSENEVKRTLLLQTDQSRKTNYATNIFPGKVAEIAEDSASAMLSIEAGEHVYLRAFLTIESLQRLGLRPGQACEMAVKSSHVELSSSRPCSLNALKGTVVRVLRGDIQSLVLVLHPLRIRICAMMPSEELAKMKLSTGSEVWASFSEFSAVLVKKDDYI